MMKRYSLLYIMFFAFITSFERQETGDRTVEVEEAKPAKNEQNPGTNEKQYHEPKIQDDKIKIVKNSAQAPIHVSDNGDLSDLEREILFLAKFDVPNEWWKLQPLRFRKATANNFALPQGMDLNWFNQKTINIKEKILKDQLCFGMNDQDEMVVGVMLADGSFVTWPKSRKFDISIDNNSKYVIDPKLQLDRTASF